MAEQLLERGDGRSVVDLTESVGVTKGMRLLAGSNRDSSGLQPSVDQVVERLGVERTPVGPHEQAVVGFRPSEAPSGAVAEVDVDCFDDLRRHRHDALLGALARHAQTEQGIVVFVDVAVDIADAEAEQLCSPQAGSRQDADEGDIARGPRGSGLTVWSGRRGLADPGELGIGEGHGEAIVAHRPRSCFPGPAQTPPPRGRPR